MLLIEHLYKKLPEFELKDISFHLPKGYIMGLVGLNASGKSVLLKTICNIYHKDSGSVFIDGLSMEDSERQIKNMLGIVLTENFYENNFSVEKNGYYFGQSFDHYNHDVFLRYCRQFQIAPDKKLKKLSKGQQMKFQIAFALSHEATLLIMDEPTGNLDQAFRLEFIQLLQELIADGKRSVLLSTHQTDTLDQIADYITFLHKGKIVFSMNKEELFEQYRIVSGCEEAIFSLPSPWVIYRERGQYNSMAMTYNPDFTPDPVQTARYAEPMPAIQGNPDDCRQFLRLLSEKDLTVHLPTLEEIMFFRVKGGIAAC